MTLKEQIAKDKLSAMKEGNQTKKLVLSTLLGELDSKSKEARRVSPELADAEVIAIVKKLIAANVECNVTDENEYLEVYMPKELSEAELTSIIKEQVETNGYSGMKDMGKIMSFLTENYAGQFDGKKVSQIVKTFLS